MIYRTFRYVALERIDDYLAVGWIAVGNLGAVHGCWSILCEWKCRCPMVEPVRGAA